MGVMLETQVFKAEERIRKLEARVKELEDIVQELYSEARARESYEMEQREHGH